MRRFLRHIAVFIPVAFSVYVLAICFLGEVFPRYFKKDIRYRRFGGGHLYSRVEEAKQFGDVDILFLGTSHCYRGFDPRIFKSAGYKSFNLGSSIQTAIQTKFLLNRYLDRLDPELVIYEVTPAAFASDGVESSVDVISNDVVDFSMVKMAFEVNQMKTYNTLIFALYKQISGFGNTQSEARKYFNDEYVSGGFVQAKLARYDGKDQLPPDRYEFKEKQWDAFNQILDLLRKKNIRVVLVQAPVTADYYYSKINNAQFDSMMISKGRYYNFNKMMHLRDTVDFYDNNHLNQNGVVAFNLRLIEMLKKDGVLH